LKTQDVRFFDGNSFSIKAMEFDWRYMKKRNQKILWNEKREKMVEDLFDRLSGVVLTDYSGVKGSKQVRPPGGSHRMTALPS